MLCIYRRFARTKQTVRHHFAQKAGVQHDEVEVRLSGGSVIVEAEVRSLEWSTSTANAVCSALQSTADKSSSLADVIGAIPSIESVKEDPDAPFTADELRVSLPEMPTNMQTENLVSGLARRWKSRKRIAPTEIAFFRPEPNLKWPLWRSMTMSILNLPRTWTITRRGCL